MGSIGDNVNMLALHLDGLNRRSKKCEEDNSVLLLLEGLEFGGHAVQQEVC